MIEYNAELDKTVPDQFGPIDKKALRLRDSVSLHFIGGKDDLPLLAKL